MKRSTSSVNVGIDVGRDRLDVFIHERQLALIFSNDDAGSQRSRSDAAIQ